MSNDSICPFSTLRVRKWDIRPRAFSSLPGSNKSRCDEATETEPFVIGQCFQVQRLMNFLVDCGRPCLKLGEPGLDDLGLGELAVKGLFAAYISRVSLENSSVVLGQDTNRISVGSAPLAYVELRDVMV